jgi:preprotein translocase subunit SecE
MAKIKEDNDAKKSLSRTAMDNDKGKKKRRVAQPRQKGRIKEYFRGVKIETKKVVWPTKKEMVSYTVIVLITCAFFSLLIWGVDSAFLAGLRNLLGIDI